MVPQHLVLGRGSAEAVATRSGGPGAIQATHHELGEYWLLCDGAPELLCTENESNASRLWGQSNASPYVKDAFHEYIIAGRGEAVNPARIDDAFGSFEEIFTSRIVDADAFYERVSPNTLNEDQRRVHRQALTGMLWIKKF